MSSTVLNVWLHGEQLGELQRLRNGGLRYLKPVDLVAEAASWGVPERTARHILEEVARAILAALEVVPASPLTDPVRDLVAQRILHDPSLR